jgi:AcrR family transcriptional regulator
VRKKGSLNTATPLRRKAILDAALAVFLERGLLGTTLDALCEAAGVGRGTLYHHFESKEEIAVELYAQGSESLRLAIAPALCAEVPFDAGIEAIVGRYLQWFGKHPELGGFMFRVHDSELLSVHVAHVRSKELAFVEQVLCWVAQHVTSGAAVRVPARIFVALVIGPSRDFVREWLARKDPRELRAAKLILPRAARISVSEPQEG